MALRIILIVVGVFLAFQAFLRVLRKNIHFPAPAFIGRLLDSDWRRMLQPPGVVIERSGIRPGMTVLELGCGSGAFTPFVARAIGNSGKLHALDIQPAMLSQLTRKLSAPRFSDITNVLPVLGSAHELPFADGYFNLVYLVTVFQEIPDKKRTLAEVKRVLRPGGILAITELLIDPDYPLRRTTVRLGVEAGFAVEEVAGSFWTYTARFRKP
ncbi:MAG: methyltransferase domain-containing protein [Spirochaetia bacterium]|jgi:ubiquinone/menaquinone biosynthesis C-methylase UbiE